MKTGTTLFKGCLVLISLLMFNLLLSAQSGRISGRVTDASTGESLPGANVFIEGTTFGVATDRFGGYRIEKIPQGEYTLKARYIGYNEYSTTVTITSGRTLQQDVELNISAVEIDDVVVQGLLQGQVKALNQQLNSQNIKNVLSREEMEKFPDMNTAETLQRIPGVTVTRSLGEGRFVYLRGTEPRLTTVTVNGQKIATPREQDRFMGLDVINSSQLASIEVSKAITPDMDGDAIGGTVDLVTRSAFDYENNSLLKLNVGGGYAELGGDPLMRGSFNYSAILGSGKNWGINIGGSWYRNKISSHSNEFDWDDEAEDVNGNQLPGFTLADYRLYNYETTRDHFGFNGEVEYRLDNKNRYFLRGMYNRRTDDQTRNMLRYRLDRGDYISSTIINEGRTGFELSYRDEIQNLYSVSFGGENKLGDWDLDYTLSYSFGEETTGDDGQLKSEWRIKDISMALDLSDVDIPGLTFTNVTQDFLLDPTNWEEDGQDFRERNASNTNIIGNLNVSYPYTLGSFQSELSFGGKVRIDQKDRDSQRYRYRWRGDDIFLSVAGTDETIDDFLLDNYVFGPIMDGEKMRDFYRNNIDPDNGFRIEDRTTDTDGLGGKYDATENIIAGYLMTTINFNNLMVLAGLRTEITQTTYEGTNLQLDDDGEIVSAAPVENDNDYTNIFPALHLKYKLSPLTNIRLAYTQGIARPDYFDLAPYRWVIPDDDEIISGNPDLEPTESKNVDLMFGHYFQGIGAINLGLFYKSLDKVIYEVSTRLEGGNFDGFDELKKVNGGSADLYGFEISWMQQLTFLPGIASGFGVYANYTYTKSDVDLSFEERNVLPGQAGDVGNFGLSYERDRFTARLSLNYTSEILVQVESDKDFDRWQDERIQLDFAGSYEFWKNFEFYVEALNLTNAPQRVYFNVTERPRENAYYGWSVRSGLKISL